MSKKNPLKFIHKLAERYRVAHGKKFRLADVNPADTWKFESPEHARDWLAQSVQMLSDLQEKLYAQDRWGVLLIFQALDAAGKDGTIKHVMSGVNPQGCEVSSFKAPSTEELDHDFLWRTSRKLPERGRIGIFNRSYYEEVLVVRVHPDLLHGSKLPPKLITRDIWKERFEDINAFERYVSRNGIVVCKFFLHVSKGEQKRRFLSRLEEPAKSWKFSLGDAREREFWDDYQKSYEEAIRHTSTRQAPWHVIPADNKWFTRLAVAAAIIDTLDSLHLTFPKVTAEKQKELAAARAALAKKHAEG
jgi:PPK2 family polyphosphate:nucleotide phosphotransferase